MTFIESKYWHLIKRTYLKKHPACEKCKAIGIIIQARDVHFKVIMKDPFLMSAESNLISVCDKCK